MIESKTVREPITPVRLPGTPALRTLLKPAQEIAAGEGVSSPRMDDLLRALPRSEAAVDLWPPWR